MFQAIKTYMTAHFGVVIFVSLLAGLFLPTMGALPPYVIPVVLMAIMFVSCARIDMTQIHDVRLKDVALFYGLRFLIVPVLLFLAMPFLDESIRAGMLLLALMPAGVTVGAMVALMGGNVILGLSLTVVSSLLCPFVVPLVFGFTGFQTIEIDLLGMLINLSLMIFVPLILYYFVAHPREKIKSWLKQEGGFFSTLLIAFIIVYVIAEQKQVMFADMGFVLVSMAVLVVLFVLAYVAVWVLFSSRPLSTRIAYAGASGMMNNALAISIAYVNFPEKVVLFCVISEFAWAFSIMLFQMYVKNQVKKS